MIIRGRVLICGFTHESSSEIYVWVNKHEQISLLELYICDNLVW